MATSNNSTNTTTASKSSDKGATSKPVADESTKTSSLPEPENSSDKSASTGENRYEVVNPGSTAFSLYVEQAGGYIDIPAEGKSAPLKLDSKGLASLKKALNKRPILRVQEIKG